MSTLRERKAIAAFAAADAAANAREQTEDGLDAAAAGEGSSNSELRADAALTAAARTAAATAASSGNPASASVARVARRSRLGALLSFLPYVLLFLAVFVGVSYVSTGTPHYGLGPHIQAQLAPPLKQFRRSLNRAKVQVQEWAGLRAPRVKKAKSGSTATPNTGYGGVTPSKKQQQSGGGSGGMPQRGVGEGAARVRITPRPKRRDPKALYLTLEELARFNGYDDPSGTILLSIYGRIFDVTSGVQHYGPQGSYSNLAAKDASRAFATNCYNNDQLHDLRGLTQEQRTTIDGWYKFYNEHETYRPVGWVDLPDIDPDSPLPNDEC